MAHHLRERIDLAKADPVLSGPKRLITVLCEAKDATIAARAAGLPALHGALVEGLFSRDDRLLAEGAFFRPSRLSPLGRRGRLKQTPVDHLVARLRTYRDEVMRFVTHLRVPFDSNHAERDLRMPKLKHKVSGCFRSPEDATVFATVRSCETTNKVANSRVQWGLRVARDCLSCGFQGTVDVEIRLIIDVPTRRRAQ